MCALKVLALNLATIRTVARFTREAHAAAQLSHHNVVQIHDIGGARSALFRRIRRRSHAKRMVDEHGKVDAEQAV